MKKLAIIAVFGLIATAVDAGDLQYCGQQWNRVFATPFIGIDAGGAPMIEFPIYEGAPVVAKPASPFVFQQWAEMTREAFQRNEAVGIRYNDTTYAVTGMYPTKKSCSPPATAPTITATAQNQAVTISMEGMSDAKGVLRYSLVQAINGKWENLYTGSPVTFSSICGSNAQTAYDVRFVITDANGIPMDKIPGTALVGLVEVCNATACAYQLDPAVGKAACGK